MNITDLRKNADPEEVGERIREVREKRGLSMSQFAELLNEDGGKAKSGTVANWEKGKNLPNTQRLKKISKIGKMSEYELLTGKKYIYEKFVEEFHNALNRFKEEIESSTFKSQIAEHNIYIEFNHVGYKVNWNEEDCRELIDQVYYEERKPQHFTLLMTLANNVDYLQNIFKRKLTDKFIKENDSSDVLQIIETIKKLDELYDSLNSFGYAEYLNIETGEWEKEIHANINRKHNTDLRNMVYNSIKSTLKIGKEHKVISSYELIERG